MAEPGLAYHTHIIDITGIPIWPMKGSKQPSNIGIVRSTGRWQVWLSRTISCSHASIGWKLVTLEFLKDFEYTVQI